MTATTVTRYICDFCGKKGYSAGHMRNHEKHCTMNPARTCRMCDDNHGENIADLALLVDDMLPENVRYDPISGRDVPRFLEDDEAAKIIKEARGMVEDCPACTLALLRQSGATKMLCFGQFNFAKEAESYLKEKHARDNEGVAYGGM